MKQNGFRLVQRKFAQGVPIPASSAAPPPPDRKPDPGPPRHVYHNKMSARSLLDIVAMQNIHKHKQPMVLLERLREDEIPPPPAPKLRLPLRKRRKGMRANKKNMCLRSGKRKAPDAGKGLARKRKKLSSESTDDIPLVYYFSKPAPKPLPTQKRKVVPGRKKRTPTQKRGEKQESPHKTDRPVETQNSKDGSFTFKEPSSPVRLSYRMNKRKVVVDPVPGRPLKSGVPLKRALRRANLRSSRSSSESSGPRSIARRLQNKKQSDNQPLSQLGPSSLEKYGWTGLTLVNQRLPSIESSISNGTISSDIKLNYSSEDPSPCSSTAGSVIDMALMLCPGLSSSPISCFDSTNATSCENCHTIVKEELTTSDEPDPCATINGAVNNGATSNAATNDDATNNAATNNDATNNAATNNDATNNEATNNDATNNDATNNAATNNDATNNAATNNDATNNAETNDGTTNNAPLAVAEPKRNQNRQSAAEPTRAEGKKAEVKRGSKPGPEVPRGRILRHTRDSPQPPAPNPDVYEFDAELEASRPPSGLRSRRTQPAPKPNADDGQIFLDVFKDNSHCIQVSPKKDAEEVPNCITVSIIKKNEIICSEKKKTLIENLSSSPSLLDKFLNCLTVEIHNELDNLIAAEQAQPGNEPRASTSRQAEVPLAVPSTPEPSTYLDQKSGSVLKAPTFYPTAEEFEDPIRYYDKIAPQASKYGLCKIVPPAGFTPPCNMSDAIRFAVIYQYISKMYSRWGPVSRELAAIKAHLRTQSVVFARSPLLDGSEVNLPKLYHAVERNGGLSNVIQRKRWGRVADEMKLSKLQHPERKLDPIYMRYLLPYATLSDQERQNIMADVESCWTTKYQKMLERARNPFQRQNRMLGTENESDDESEDGNTAGALHEAEDCIVQGRTMNLATFKKIATSLMEAHFEPGKQPRAVDVEKAYWRAVLLGTEHIVANTASIDTGEEGYGFPKDPEAEYGTHPWNLKVLARNPKNVLRYLGPVLGVTVPTLHLSMLFSTSCWHRDPHGLPWTEYMHSGAEKIWYGIPSAESSNFRRAVETLCPAYCQNKSIWLASEITMVPPNILSEHGVKLSRLLQKPGEYVLVFPEAHSCSITTGLAVSESVYFASNTWLSSVYKLFQELRNSCEPTMFSLEQLLLNGSEDLSAPHHICSVLCTLVGSELEHRRVLEAKGLKVQEQSAPETPLNTSYFRAWNARDQDECEYCRSTLFFSKVTGLTGRKSAVCPEHALRLLETKKHKHVDLGTLEFVSSHSTVALEQLLENLEARASDDDFIDLTQDRQS